MCCRTKTCCFYSSVETGTKVIAIIGLIFTGLVLIPSVLFLRWSSISTSLVNLLLSGMLLYGVNTRKPGFILAWLVVDMIEIILGYISVVASVVVLLMIGDETIAERTRSDPGSFRLIFHTLMGVVLLFLAFFTYLWTVVYSFYKEVQEEYSSSLVMVEVGGNPDMKNTGFENQKKEKF